MKKILFVVASTFFSTLIIGQVPMQINYQGIARNSSGNTLASQNISLRLSIHDISASGTVLYQETRNIKTDRFGMFITAIGSSGAIDVQKSIKDINWSSGSNKYLQVEILLDKQFINMGAAQLLSVPFAFAAENAHPIGQAGGSLSGQYPNPVIAINAVTTNKINDGAVTTEKLGDTSITTAKIVDRSVTAIKLANGVIPSTLPPTGIASGDLGGSYPNPVIALNAITTSKISDGSVTTNKLADTSITTAKIVDGSVTTLKLANGVIPSTLPPTGIAGGDLNGAYPNPQISVNAITTNKISDGSVTTNKLADASITTGKIADGSVTATKIASGIIPTTLPPSGIAGGDLNGSYPNPVITLNAVTTNKISDGSVTTKKLADASITTAKIADGSVTAVKLANGIIPSSLPPTGIAGGDLNGSYPNPGIAINAVTTNKISDGSVTTQKLADASITTVKIADGSVTATKIASGIIPTTLPPSGTAGGDLSGNYPNPTIANSAINTSKIADGSITASKIASGVIPLSLPPNGTASGDLGGSYPSPVVSKIQTIGVSSTVPSTGQILKFNGSQWAPADEVVAGSGSTPAGPAGGDLNGTYPDPKIRPSAITTNKIAANAVTNAKLADDAVSTVNILDGAVTSAKLAPGVIPTSLPPGGGAGGDLSGTFPNPSVDKIKGVTVSNTAPTSGQILKFNGTQWSPSADSIDSFSIPFSSSASSSSSLFSVTNQSFGSAIEGLNSTVNPNAFGVIGKINSTTPGSLSSGLRGINNGTNDNGYGIWGSHAGAGSGVYGSSISGMGINGFSNSGYGVYANSATGAGIYATSTDGLPGMFDISNPNAYNDAVLASNGGYGNGITSIATYGNGLLGIGNDIYGTGVLGINNAGGEAILGFTISDNGSAVVGRNDGTYAAVRGFNTSNNGIGVLAIANSWGATNGTALIAELEGSDAGNTAVFKANNSNVARIDNTGKGFFNGGTQMGGADIAEFFDVEGNLEKYEPGDVLIISQDSDRKVEKSSSPYSTLVAGVYATKPGVLLTEKNAEQDVTGLMVPMGVIGVIPTKVCLEGGPISRGDLLVTSSVSGVAMKADLNKAKVGQTLGKALQPFSKNTVGKINVLVSVK